MPGMDFQGLRLWCKPIHPVEDDNVGEFIQIIKRFRQSGFDFYAGDNVIPVVRRLWRFPDLVSHDAYGL